MAEARTFPLPARARAGRRRRSPLPGFGLTLGVTLAFVGAIVLLPLAGLGWQLTRLNPSEFLAVPAVQPLIEKLDPAEKAAAATFDAGRWQTFLLVTLPHLLPVILTGTGLSFVRSLGEFGAVIFIAGNLPYKTEVASLLIMIRLDEFDYPAAAAIAGTAGSSCREQGIVARTGPVDAGRLAAAACEDDGVLPRAAYDRARLLQAQIADLSRKIAGLDTALRRRER